jgi:hypothetical protein
VVGLGACSLEIVNPNSPTYPQVRGTPKDLENFIGTQFRRWHVGHYGAGLMLMTDVMSFENYSELSNNCQGQRVGMPRPGNDNQVGNTCAGDQSRIFFIHSEVARGMADALRRMNEGLTFGTQANDARNRSFAEFLRGVSLGYLSLIYDSASVITPQDSISALGTAVPGVFSGYQEVNAAALAALDSAIVAANAAAARPASESGNFPLPGTWINGYTPSAPEFVKLLRSWKAKFRASVARTPQERAQVNWDAVIADAQNGITADWRVTTNTVTGPGFGALSSHYNYGTWHQMTPFIMGMADVSGTYATWVSQSLDSRGAGAIPFFMVTPDQRFPQGADRAAQQADLTHQGVRVSGSVPKRYFVNRNTSDPTGASWGRSQYDHVRFAPWRYVGSTAGSTGGNGPFPFFTLAELNMLEAEGHLRKGNVSAAAALINRTRSTCGFGGVPAGCTPRAVGNGDNATGYTAPIGGGLPAIPSNIAFGGINADGSTTRVAGDDVPGDPACVPRVPVGASISGGGTTRCGNIWEAMKYEKRIETLYAGFANWYFDGRGWGSLPLATPLSWSPPWEELTTRFWTAPQIAAYGQGGPFPMGGAALSTYGW